MATPAARTTCPRGHELTGANLDAYQARRGRRACRACSLTHNWAAYHDVSVDDEAFVEYADMKYRSIVEGTADRKTGAAVTHCPRGHAYAGPNLYVTASGKKVCRSCKAAHTYARRHDLDDVERDAYAERRYAAIMPDELTV